MAEIERIAPDTIRMERLLDAPVETVWRYLTDAELRARWFAGGAIEPRVGGDIALCFDHANLSADDVPTPERYAPFMGHIAHETIAAIEEPRLLAYSWDGGKEGTVRFELFPQGERTRLVLTHSGISGPVGMADFGGGWMSHLAVLQSILAGDPVRDFWKVHAASQATVQNALG